MTNTLKNNEPVARVKDGMIQIAIWRNQSEKGKVFYSTSKIKRSYKDDAGNYQETDSLSGTQLLQASQLYSLAYARIRELEESDYQASKANQGKA